MSWCGKRKAAVFAVMASLFSLSPLISAEEKGVPVKRRIREEFFTGFAKYRSDFRSMCDGIAEDGHRPALLILLHDNIDAVSDCNECRSLFSLLSQTCRDPSVRFANVSADDDSGNVKSEAVISTPSPDDAAKIGKNVVREPNLTVLDRVSTVVRELADDDKMALRNLAAIKRLVSVLHAAPNLSAEEREYFDIFSEYLLSAFVSNGVGQDKSAPGNVAQEETPEITEETFDF